MTDTSNTPATHKPTISGSDRIGYRIREACQVVPCSKAHLYRLAKAGKIEIKKVGGLSIVTAKSLRAMVEGEAA